MAEQHKHGPLSDAAHLEPHASMPRSWQKRLGALRGNSSCVDCGEKEPEWASLSHGTLLCLRCSGKHRSLGVTVSFVRSILMDSWTDAQLTRMELSGGNDAFERWLTENGVGHSDQYLRYLTPVAQLWRDKLTARCDGVEEPTEIPLPLAELPALTRALEGRPGPGVEEWAKDGARCQLCDAQFSMLFRRHHCRRCGRCVCKKCAPSHNTRPIPEAGLRECVRHCYKCYRSPLVDWAHLPASDDRGSPSSR
eukprot:TRINITY_DN46832_c0_g1_i1.p1 TRINITY_DN46832_c0_g1~~TRINITY_DN46832_c0_g1_i1.p1  ORF type:complete len:251 (+),score=47.14 TRINITY_DN46832_c0_g1_i1:73-825(+)